MAKKKPEQLAKIEIVCTDDELANVVVEGDRNALIAALASLMADDSKDNTFNDLLHVAMSVVLYAKEQKSAKKKKAAPKKKAHA